MGENPLSYLSLDSQFYVLSTMAEIASYDGLCFQVYTHAVY